MGTYMCMYVAVCGLVEFCIGVCICNVFCNFLILILLQKIKAADPCRALKAQMSARDPAV